ncbi:presqualene diphosphate synthase HpnD [Phenylobacterium sp.]|uniref:presqualene diphosphate synthase HpnD n=1 Tax=Phenylobacterium sp. TaxID=1871053 RepID=UPI0025ECD167|nr:presqualene diphosphate synthase HpnD [Phenylobacterium sp.]
MAMTLSRPADADPKAAAANAQAASGSSFYAGMRVLPKAEREAMYAIYGFCRVVDDIADDQTMPIPQQRVALDAWRADLEALYAGGDPGQAAMLADAVARYRLDKEDFLAVVDGMQMDLEGIVRPDLETLYLYCDRVAVAVGRLSIRVFGMADDPGLTLAHHLGRALQLTNVLRDVDEDADIGRLYLPDELLTNAGIANDDPHEAILMPGVDAVCRELAETAQAHFREANRILAAKPPGRLAAPRLMEAAYAGLLKQMQARGWAAPRTQVKVKKAALIWLLLTQGLFG